MHGIEEEKLDEKAVLRVFSVGQKILLRVLGRDTKLVDAWEGPYDLAQQLKPVTYKVDTGRK